MVTKKHHATWKREWRAKNPDKTKQIARESMQRYYAKTKDTDIWRTRAKIQRNKARKFIIDFFGGKCAKCGFKDPRALQMDHINGRNGSIRLGNIDNRYSFVKNYPEKAKKTYQLLCANCNFIKRDVNQEYYFHPIQRLNFQINILNTNCP